MTIKNSKHKADRHRDDLAGEHRIGDAGQLLFAILFFLVWTADTFFLKYTTFLNNYIPNGIRTPFGILVLVVSGYLAKTGLNIVFGEEHQKTEVIRKGVFNVVRHPIYLGEILLYLGMLILSLSLAAAVVWIVTIVFLHFISRFEENLLLERFGESYRKYMQEVPMWFPRIF
jgi:protein-S-isoprenylcysteine O-methyltransferase Ste14